MGQEDEWVVILHFDDPRSLQNWLDSSWGAVLEGDPVLPSDDPDQDGALNQEEFVAGTDPRDPADVLALEIQKDGPLSVVAWPSKLGRHYQLYGTADFSVWTPASGLTPGTGEAIRFPLNPSTRFYRVQAVNQ